MAAPNGARHRQGSQRSNSPTALTGGSKPMRFIAEQLRADYEGGLTQREIAAKHGTTERIVRGEMKRHGIAGRKAAGRRQRANGPVIQKSCTICGAIFQTANQRRSLCSARCKWTSTNRRRKPKKVKRTWKGYSAIRYKRDRDKILARNAVREAVRRGRLIRPDGCSLCQCAGPVEAHHHKGYALEVRLDITWLCKRCHRKADGMEAA
jgi:hypothetical protein